MKEQIKILVKLQHLDTETVRIKSTLNDVSKKLENLDSSLKEIEQTIWVALLERRGFLSILRNLLN